MSGALIFIAIMVAIVAASVVALYWLSVPRPQPVRAEDPLLAKTLLVHTKDDQTIRGVLHANHADRLTLVQAVYVGAQGDTDLSGPCHINHDNIRFIQEIPVPDNTDDRHLKAVNKS